MPACSTRRPLTTAVHATDSTMQVFVVYDRPRDFPRHIVVREQRVLLPSNQIAAAFTGCLYDTLTDAMNDYAARGLIWMPRHPDDEPQIVGVWL